MATRRVERWILALLVTLHPALAAAQASHVSLVIDGRGVTLDARDAPLRDILAEWSRVGGTKVMNAETLDPRPVTISLSGVGERQALDILLRDIGGYILSARKPDEHTVSQFAGLVVVPARAGAAVAPAAAPRAVTMPVFTLTQPDPDPSDDTPQVDARPPVPGQPGAARTPFSPEQSAESSDTPNEGAPRPAALPFVPRRTVYPGSPSGASDPSRPFGPVVGAARPGENVPAPNQPRGITETERPVGVQQ